MGAQFATASIGAWLFVSAFLWPHSRFQFHNSIVCGLLAMALALAGTCIRETASLGAMLAMWLLLSAFLVPAIHDATFWNNFLTAIAIWGISMACACRHSSRASR